MNTTKKQIFNENQNDPGKKESIFNGGNHPPKNNIVLKELIKSILAYSPNENNANPMGAQGVYIIFLFLCIIAHDEKLRRFLFK